MKQLSPRPDPDMAVASTEPGDTTPTRPPEYRSDELLRETREAAIVHRGQRYILRETRSGKLILYK